MKPRAPRRKLNAKTLYFRALKSFLDRNCDVLPQLQSQYGKCERWLSRELALAMNTHLAGSSAAANLPTYTDCEYRYADISVWRPPASEPLARSCPSSSRRAADVHRRFTQIQPCEHPDRPVWPQLRRQSQASKLDAPQRDLGDGFLEGAAEAKAFTDGEFVKLHQSTLRKVDNLVSIYERTVRGELKTNAKLREIYGGLRPWLVGQVQEHWLFVLLALIGSIASIIGLAFTL